MSVGCHLSPFEVGERDKHQKHEDEDKIQEGQGHYADTICVGDGQEEKSSDGLHMVHGMWIQLRTAVIAVITAQSQHHARNSAVQLT